MVTKIAQPTQQKIDVYPLLPTKERLLIWERVKGMWKDRKPNPIQELKQMRKEWER